MLGFIKEALFKLVPEHKKWELKRKYLIPSMEWRMHNLKKNGFSPTSIIDIGAYEGQWTPTTQKISPQARVLVMETQAGKQRAKGFGKAGWIRIDVQGCADEICSLICHLPGKALGQTDIFFAKKDATLTASKKYGS